MDVRDAPKLLPELRKASVDGMEILMHGRCDVVSIDDRALRRAVFGISNEGCDRGLPRSSRPGFPMPPLCAFSMLDSDEFSPDIPIRFLACVEPS